MNNPAAAEGSPVQGELSVDRLTEGLVLTNKTKEIEATLPSFSCENATSPCTGEAKIVATFVAAGQFCKCQKFRCAFSPASNMPL